MFRLLGIFLFGLIGLTSMPALSPLAANLPECPKTEVALWNNCHGQTTLGQGHKYSGEFDKGIFNGHGTEKYPNGGKYIGYFKNGKRSGLGTMQHPDGTTYIGEYKDDKANGMGALTIANGDKCGSICGEKYIGQMKENKPHGQGKKEYKDGSRYIGEWHSGIRNGQGTFLWPDGTSYKGTWSRDKRHGMGVMKFADGTTYLGEFKNDAFDGWGHFKMAQGQEYKGQLKINKRHGIGVFRDDKDSLEEGIWENDALVSSQKVHPSSVPAFLSDESLLFAFNKFEREISHITASDTQAKKNIGADHTPPEIEIQKVNSSNAQGIIYGIILDDNGLAELRAEGQLVRFDDDGRFSYSTYVPEGGVSVSIQAVDLAGLSSSMTVRLDRAAVQTAAFRFDRLNPLGRKVAKNKDAVAIIVGVSDYKETTARAAYADSDAKVFQDYAIEKLGVPRDRIKTLVNDGADEKDMLLAVKRWLARASKRDKTDVYIFFAGHGLASDDGEKMYLLPHDGAPELLDDTAILRDRLFSDIASANPRSVTVFLDTCYSGTTRGTDMLIASRPIAIKALKQSIPDNFTVMTAARGDQTAKPLEEAKHGMFSYFLMKGMEGEADANNDNEITAGELHSYVQTNVVQQSSGSQTPELQGDADRVLVRFQ